jgi:MFS family permease
MTIQTAKRPSAFLINTFSAFRSRNFRLYFSGRLVSQIGTWMQRTSVSWLVFTMTHSSLMLGVSAFASQFPSFLFSLFGGVLSDRYSKKRILLITQTASMLQAVLMAALVISKQYNVWEILFLSTLLGIINAFDSPARQSMINDIIDTKDDLPNALALTSSINNFSRLIGPAIAGLVLLKFGSGFCFLLNAISFAAVLLSLLMIRWPAYLPAITKKKMSADLLDGFRYLRNTPNISLSILMLALISLLVLPYNTLLPIFARVVYKGDAATFGYLNSFIGLGAIAGLMFLASLKPGANLKMVLLFNTISMGICMILFSLSNSFLLAMIFATIGSFGMTSQTTISNTIVQGQASSEMRGRVVSILLMAYFGMLPLGSMLVGIIAQKIGAQHTVFCQGILALFIIAGFFKYLTNKDIDILPVAN